MFKAAIFDMDGLLINSEPYWKQAEIEVFSSVGLHLTEKMCEQTTGLRIDACVKHWYMKKPWSHKTCAQVEAEIIEKVSASILAKAEPMEGVDFILKMLDSESIVLAVCSSSPLKIIEDVLCKLDIRQKFKVVHSAENEQFGKPHPSVYLKTTSLLGIPTNECIAFEDSITGIISAKAASIKTVAVPERGNFSDTRYDFCDYKINKLSNFNLEKAKNLFL